MKRKNKIAAKEIIDNELFLKNRRAKWHKARFVFYFVVFLLIFVPEFIPIPFAPNFLHDIFAGEFSALITPFMLFLLALNLIILLVFVLYKIISKRGISKSILIEIFIVPVIFIGLSFFFITFFKNTPEKLVSLNKEKPPEKFSNPYLNYKMLDCRNITEEFDVVFIPAHLMIETEYLAYAPRRKDKTLHYKNGKKFGEDWYLDFSGSMWGDDLKNCLNQNKSPNN